MTYFVYHEHDFSARKSDIFCLCHRQYLSEKVTYYVFVTNNICQKEWHILSFVTDNICQKKWHILSVTNITRGVSMGEGLSESSDSSSELTILLATALHFNARGGLVSEHGRFEVSLMYSNARLYTAKSTWRSSSSVCSIAGIPGVFLSTSIRLICKLESMASVNSSNNV